MQPRKSSCSDASREQMIEEHVGLVHHVARRVARTAGRSVELEDLISGGMIGLVQAVDSFEPARKLAFSTYAAPRIRGAILDNLRMCDHASRLSRRRQRTVHRTETTLRAELARAPRHEETADRLGISPETLWEWKESGCEAVHVPGVGSGDGGAVADTVVGADADAVEAPLERREQLNWLRGRLSTLPERERMVLALYYVRELKLREIAEVLGVTESRVSQMRTAALARLRAAWQAGVPA